MKIFSDKVKNIRNLQALKSAAVYVILISPLIFCTFYFGFQHTLPAHPAVNHTTMSRTNAIGTSLLFAAFLIEFALVLLHRPDQECVRDTMANFTIGVSTVLVGSMEKVGSFGLYSLSYSFAFFKPQPVIWLWIAGLLSCDFMHYLFHRLGHTTRLFWAAHVTHHSSRYFNLSTGFRVNGIHLFYRFVFWSPLCLFGIPPEMILFIESVTASQNFLVHTEKIRKLGVLDWIFNTPSNHRVHHGSNPEYIDKNMGGMTMIYDHLFGTYEKEVAAPVYGITHNIDTHNPAKILLHEYVRLGKEFSGIRGVFRKLHYLFSRPQ